MDRGALIAIGAIVIAAAVLLSEPKSTPVAIKPDVIPPKEPDVPLPTTIGAAVQTMSPIEKGALWHRLDGKVLAPIAERIYATRAAQVGEVSAQAALRTLNSPPSSYYILSLHGADPIRFWSTTREEMQRTNVDPLFVWDLFLEPGEWPAVELLSKTA